MISIRWKLFGILLFLFMLLTVSIFMTFPIKNANEGDTFVSEISMKSNQEIKWWKSQGISVSLTDITSNVFIEDLLIEKGFHEVIPIVEVNQNVSIMWVRQSGITMTMKIMNVQLFNKYYDVEHPENDNNFILRAKSPSVAADLQKPLINIINNFCREPLPDHYFLTMTPYDNRYTRAKKIICNKNQMATGSVRCPDHYYNGQIYAYRTVNDQCSHNKATYLSQDTDSFFCTQNTPILNILFRENITEKIEFQSMGDCQRYRKECEKCFRTRCRFHSKYFDSSDYENCCQFIPECLLQPSCIDYFSQTCYYIDLAEHQHNLCIKGTTYEFALNPQFHLTNNSFMCHIKPSSDQFLYQINVKLSIPHWMKTVFFLSENITKLKYNEIKNETFEYHSNLMNIRHRFKSSTLFDDAILKYKSGKYSLFKMKTKFSETRPIIEKHLHVKYTKIQASYPFAINTKNWMKRSCFTNIDDLYEDQTIYDETPNISVNMVKLNRGEDRQFHYYVSKSNVLNNINLSLKGKSSILKSALCYKYSGNSRSNLSKLVVDFRLKSQFNWSWNLEIKGELENSYDYLNIQLRESRKSQLIFNKDILIIRLPVTEKNQFSFNHSLQFFPYSASAFSDLALELSISDCHKIVQYRMNIEPKYNETLIKIFNNSYSESAFLNESNFRNKYLYSILWKLFFVFIILSVLVLILTVIIIILKFQNTFTSKSLVNVKCRKMFWKIKSEKSKRFVIVFYIALRIIYTFIFTSTCIISIILTININSMIYNNNNISWNYHLSNSDQNPKGFSLKVDHHNDKCELVTRLRLRKLLKKFDENKRDTLSSWYQSKISLPIISADLFKMNSTNLMLKIRGYLQRKIMKNIQLRLGDQIGPLKGIVDETLKLKWLNILSSWSNEKQNVKFNILPIFLTLQVQNSIMSKLNKSQLYWWEDKNIFKNPKLPLKEFKTFKGRLKFLRYYSSSVKGKYQSVKHPKLIVQRHDYRNLFGGKNLSFIKIRISLLILDLLLILFRCYHIYQDFQIIWFGSEKLIPYNYSSQIPEGQFESNMEQFMFERKSIPSRLVSNKIKKSPVLSSLEYLRFFRSDYCITLVIFCGLSLIAIFIFIILQSSQITAWIRSLFSVQIKYVPIHYINRFQKKIFSLFAAYNKRRKHQRELEFQIISNNQNLLLKRFNHNQRHQQNVQNFELCTILMIFSDSKNSQILKMKMQSQFLFIPLQIVEDCLNQENTRVLDHHIQQQYCHLSNHTPYIISPESGKNSQNPKEIELLLILQMRDFLLIITSVFVISILSSNLLKIIMKITNLLIEKKISKINILHFQPTISNDSNQPFNNALASYPLLKYYNSEEQDPYFSIDLRSSMKYLLVKLNDNRETDI